MRRHLQHPMPWCGVFFAAAFLLSNFSPLVLSDQPPLDFKAYTETIPGTAVKFDMVPIPGGTFLMGSPASEQGHENDEGPQHPVAIHPFWMGKTEVTWEEYDQYWKKQEGAV